MPQVFYPPLILGQELWEAGLLGKAASHNPGGVGWEHATQVSAQIGVVHHGKRRAWSSRPRDHDPPSQFKSGPGNYGQSGVTANTRADEAAAAIDTV